MSVKKKSRVPSVFRHHHWRNTLLAWHAYRQLQLCNTIATTLFMQKKHSRAMWGFALIVAKHTVHVSSIPMIMSCIATPSSIGSASSIGENHPHRFHHLHWWDACHYTLMFPMFIFPFDEAFDFYRCFLFLHHMPSFFFILSLLLILALLAA